MYTSTWRRKRAARLQLKGGSHWHRARRDGQAERFERVARCGAVDWVLQRHDGKGTTERFLKTRCDCWRVCDGCMRRRRWLLTEGIHKQREVAFQLHARQMARWYRGAEGRWSEKLLTFTVQHDGSTTPAEDARVLTKAWRELYTRLADHMKKDRGVKVSPVWVRAMEVAPGKTGGHAHLHVWWFGPFVDHAWLRSTWGKVLEKMGRKVPRVVWSEALHKSVDKRFKLWGRTRRGPHGKQPATVPWPIVDVRSGSSRAVSEYVTKVGVSNYVMKSEGISARLHPLHAATVYQALESARCVQWAMGWAPKRQKVEGVVWSRRRLTEEERAQVNKEHEREDRAVLQKIEQLASLAVAQPLEAVPPQQAPPRQLALGV